MDNIQKLADYIDHSNNIVAMTGSLLIRRLAGDSAS